VNKEKKINRKIKRQSKRTELELENLRKAAAKKARTAMVETFKEDICEAVAQEFFGKNLLDKLEQLIVQPFVHKNNGYKTVVDSKEASCINLLTISAIDNVLGERERQTNFPVRPQGNATEMEKNNGLQTPRAERTELLSVRSCEGLTRSR